LPRDDVCRLQIVKNRLEGRGSIYLRMTGEDRFDLSSYAYWRGKSAKGENTLKSKQAKEEIAHFLCVGNWYSRTEILEAMKQAGIGRDAVDAGLDALERGGIVISKREGKGGSLLFCLRANEDMAFAD